MTKSERAWTATPPKKKWSKAFSFSGPLMLAAGRAGAWQPPPMQGRFLADQMPSASSSSLPAFMQPPSDGLSCPAGWFMEGGAPPPSPSRARALQGKGGGILDPQPPPPPPEPNAPGQLAPCSADDLVGVGDRCFVNIRSDQPCQNSDDVGRICLTIDKPFHFAFIAGTAPICASHALQGPGRPFLFRASTHTA